MLRAGAYRRRIENRIRAGNTRCLQWRRDLQPASNNSPPPDPDPQGARRDPARRPRGDRRRPRPPVAGLLARRRARRIARSAHVEPRECRPRRHDGLRRRRSRGSPSSIRRSSAPCARPRRSRDDGVEFVVDSGWRSRAYQEQLLREAISKYGSEAEAARWVATPNTSAHVSGDAVDLGSSGARRGCPSTAPRTGCAGSTATSPGTTSCARTPPLAAARPCTPTPPTIQGCSHDSTPRRPCADRADQRGLWLERALRDRHRQQHRHQEGHRPGQGGEVRRVRPGARRPRLPGPEREGRLRVRGQRDRHGVEEGHQRVQGPAATGLVELQADPQAADGEPPVRPVHPRERREGLPGPRQGRAARQHLQDPVLQSARGHDDPQRRDEEVRRRSWERQRRAGEAHDVGAGRRGRRGRDRRRGRADRRRPRDRRRPGGAGEHRPGGTGSALGRGLPERDPDLSGATGRLAVRRDQPRPRDVHRSCPR